MLNDGKHVSKATNVSNVSNASNVNNTNSVDDVDDVGNVNNVDNAETACLGTCFARSLAVPHQMWVGSCCDVM